MIHSGPYMGLVDLVVNGKRFYEEHYFISCLSFKYFFILTWYWPVRTQELTICLGRQSIKVFQLSLLLY